MKSARINQNPATLERETKLVSITSMMQLFSSASDALFAQANLHRELAIIEWEEEKERLSHMLTAFLIGFSCFICLLFFLGILTITLFWSTDYQWVSILTLSALYGLVTYFSWKRFMVEAKRPGRFFTTTREEIAADLSMIKNNLD